MKRTTILTLLIALLLTLNACSKTKAYQLVFESNGGSSVEAIQYNEGETITLPTNPTKDGLSFTGWYLNEKLTVPFELPATMPAKSIKVYAKYQAKLTFNSNGGSELEDIFISPGAIISKPANPVYEGHVFLGWYTDEACTQKLPMFMPETSVTAYAKWMSKDDPNATRETIGVFDDISNHIVHDADLRAIVNELKNAGAEAISINGQRLVNTTAITCIRKCNKSK